MRPYVGGLDMQTKKFLFLLLFLSIYLSGCAGTFNPQPIDEARYRNRAEAQTDGDIQILAVVLSREESEAVFDLDLYDKGIQPIWLEVDNRSEERIWIPPVGIDRNYFPPSEVAYRHHFSFSKKANQQMNQYFHDQALGLYVSPNQVRSGYVFTNLNLGTKIFNVDILGEDEKFRTFTFFITVPGLGVSHQDVDLDTLYSRDEFASYDDEDELRKALERLPCCTTNADGTKQGDPLNLVFVGSRYTLHKILIRRGWHITGSVKQGSASKGKRGSVLEKQYRYVAPISPFYLYGRVQDAAFRKSRETADERNHLRLWLLPIRFDGKSVWVGQISRDIKVRYLANTFKLEPLVDEARTYMLQDLWYSQGLAKYGYVAGVGASSMSLPQADLDGDPYFTDGYRLVLWVSKRPISFSEVDNVHWEVLQPVASDYEQ